MFESGERDHRLDRRAGRIHAAHGAIEQRPIRIFIEAAELGARQAAREHVRIEARSTDERQHVARVGIEGDHRGALAEVRALLKQGNGREALTRMRELQADMQQALAGWVSRRPPVSPQSMAARCSSLQA